MNLQIIAANLRYPLKTGKSGLSGQDRFKRTPVRVVFGDPKRNCAGFGLCRMDMGESSLISVCQTARVEFGMLISELNGPVGWLFISQQSWRRWAVDYQSTGIKEYYLKISEQLSSEIGSRTLRLLVQKPSEEQLNLLCPQIRVNIN